MDKQRLEVAECAYWRALYNDANVTERYIITKRYIELERLLNEDGVKLPIRLNGRAYSWDTINMKWVRGSIEKCR